MILKKTGYSLVDCENSLLDLVNRQVDSFLYAHSPAVIPPSLMALQVDCENSMLDLVNRQVGKFLTCRQPYGSTSIFDGFILVKADCENSLLNSINRQVDCFLFVGFILVNR